MSMLMFVRDHFVNFLSDPNNNYAFTWICTVISALAGVLGWFFFPGTGLNAFCASTYLILQCWNWYYEEWIENSLHSQDRLAIGNRAIIVNLRVTVAGAAAGILVSMLLAAMLKLDLASGLLLFVYFGWVAAIAVSFISGTVKRILVSVLKEVCSVPFGLAFIWMGITTDEAFLDSRFKRVNAVAKKLFFGISGYSSNLTLLHNTDYILRRLPTRS